jgi:glycosyltransferase involved in cell wall biosynthesis
MTPKLLALCVSSKYSGGEIYTVQLLSELQKLGWRTALAGPENERLQAAAELNDIHYHSQAGIGPKLGKRTALRTVIGWRRKRKHLVELVDRVQPDVLLLQYKLEQLLWAGRPSKTRVILLEHGPIPRWIRAIPALRRRYAATVKNADICVAASVPAQTALRDWSREAILIAAGVDPQRVAAALANPIRPLGKESGGKKIGIYAGRVTAAKGVFVAANAIAASQDLGLAVFGGGDDLERIRAISRQDSSVQVMGAVDDVLPYIAGSDFAVLLTDDPGEGRPLFAVECIACGIPVIGSKSSAAMRGLKKEFPRAVELVDVRDSAGIEAAVREIRRFEPQALSWDASAGLLDHVLKFGHPKVSP